MSERELLHSIVIAAPIDAVWAELTRLDGRQRAMMDTVLDTRCPAGRRPRTCRRRRSSAGRSRNRDTETRYGRPCRGSAMSTHRPTQRATLSELEDLLVKGGAAVIATDLDGVITHWSAGAERLYGWSGDEAIGRPILDLMVSLGDHALGEEAMDDTRHTGGWEGEFEVRHKDGSLVLAFIRGTVIKDDAGRSVGMLSLSMDASASPDA